MLLLGLLLLAVTSLVMLLQHLKIRRWHQMVKHIPAPPALPIIGHGLLFIKEIRNFNMIYFMLQYLEKFDDFVPIWAGPQLVVFLSHPDDLQIYYSHFKTTDRSRSYDFINSILGHQSLFSSSGETWRKNRRLIAPAFHPNVIKSFSPIVHKHSNVLVDVLRETVGTEFDVAPYMRRLGFDLILETSLDMKMDAQRSECGMLNDMLRLMDIVNGRIYRVWLHPDFIFNATPEGREQLVLVKRVQGYINTIVDDWQENILQNFQDKKENPDEAEKKQSPFIYHMLKNGYSLQEIKEQIATIIVTGFDTTAGVLSFVLMTLGMHQDVQERLYQEVMAVEESLGGRELDVEDVNLYTYMDLVLKETMRVFPIGPLIARRCSEDIKFSKCTIPKGADLAAAMFKTHRDPRWFPDPLKFDPDRFLPENSEGRHPYCYVPFSAGPRNCIGLKYAHMTLRIVLSRIVMRYKVHCRLTIPDVKIKAEITAKAEGGFLVTLEERT